MCCFLRVSILTCKILIDYLKNYNCDKLFGFSIFQLCKPFSLLIFLMISTKLLVFFNNKSSLVYSYDFYIVLDNRGVSSACKFKL